MIDIKGAGTGLLIDSCNLNNGGNYIGSDKPNSNQTDFSFIYSEWDSTTVTNNNIVQNNIDIALENYTGGIELHGSHSNAFNNIIKGCWPAIYITSSREDLQNVTISNNKMIDCVKGISFWVIHAMNRIFIKNNKISLTYTRSEKINMSAGIEMPNGNAQLYKAKLANAAPVTEVIISNNFITSNISANTELKTAGMLLHSLQHSIIEGNTITKMNYAGINFSGSKWGMNDVIIINNRFENFRPNNDKNTVAGYVVITDTYSPEKPEAPGMHNIVFEKNKFIGSAPIDSQKTSQAKGKFSCAFVALQSSLLDEVIFRNNEFTNPSESVLKVKTD